MSKVVSYRNSTSNHNRRPRRIWRDELYLIEILHQTTTYWLRIRRRVQLYLIEILHQTTTRGRVEEVECELYLIEILHQTTTVVTAIGWRPLLYLIEILHQTTTLRTLIRSMRRCILSKFYIKPQRVTLDFVLHTVVSYRNSTSNHNCAGQFSLRF